MNNCFVVSKVPKCKLLQLFVHGQIESMKKKKKKKKKKLVERM